MSGKSSAASNDNLIIGTLEQVNACLANLKRQDEQIKEVAGSLMATGKAHHLREWTRKNLYIRLDTAADRYMELLEVFARELESTVAPMVKRWVIPVIIELTEAMSFLRADAQKEHVRPETQDRLFAAVEAAKVEYSNLGQVLTAIPFLLSKQAKKRGPKGRKWEALVKDYRRYRTAGLGGPKDYCKAKGIPLKRLKAALDAARKAAQRAKEA
jgi:hypothetical protein